MQDDNIEDPTSISQLLRESYLAESIIHHENSEQSSTISSSHSYHHNLCSAKVDELGGTDDFSDLSAFLSQEELDQSVHLARQSIDQDGQQKEAQSILKCPPRELRKQAKSSVRSSLSTPNNPTVTDQQQHSNFRQEHVLKGTQNSADDTKDTKKQQRINPYGSESESKKEFLNKAADFIEELSSLFKANSSKRIRPKTLKNRRSKRDVKSGTLEEDISNYTSQSENRERPLYPPVETEIDATVSEEPESLEAVGPEIEKEVLEGETNTASSFYLEETIAQPPNFIQKLKSREVTEGSKVQLDCIVVGIPAPEVRWYCEGKELENSPYIQIQRTGDLNTLIITEAFEEDTGRYSCFASNINGTDSTSAEIYVEGASSSESDGETSKNDMDQSQSENLVEEESNPEPLQEINVPITVVQHTQPTVTQQSSTTYLQDLDGRPLMAAPVFTKTLQDITSSESQLVVFESRVKGSPSPKVEWYREGTLIEDSPDFRILQKKPRSMAEPAEEICTLVIAEVFSEDSGMFTCTASNKYGTTSSTAYLNVKGSNENPNKPTLTISTINIDAFKREPLPSTPPPVLVEPPPKPKLEGVLVNHNEPRPSSKIGLRVHFNLPDDDKGSESSSEEGVLMGRNYGLNNQDMLNGQSYSALPGSMKEPPPVFAKPKLDAMKLQQLHNQVMNEQQVQPSTPNVMARDVLSSPAMQNPSTAAQPYMFSLPQQFLTSSELVNTYPVSTFNTVSPTRPWAVGTQSTSNTSSVVSSPSSSTVQPQYSVNESILPAAPPIPPSWNQFQAQTVPPSPVSPPRIQNPVAFLSSVLPSLPSTPTVTNSMGLPKSASSFAGTPKKNSKLVWFSSQDQIQESKNQVVRELEKKLSFKEDVPTPRQQEYKISSFEQRLMNEIEFRLERTPVDESDDEIQHDEIPTGKCIAPIFDRRLKHFRVVEGASVTFTCKVVGIPIPKVYWFKDGKQISKKNEHCKMKREADGTCLLHIESATNDDDGNYTIMAANPQGRISCSGHLLVQSAPLRPRSIPTVLSHRVRPRLLEVESESVQERFFRPYFLQAPGDMVAHEGRLCRLDCKVSGLPTPDIMWLLNGIPVNPDLTHKMLVRENGVHSLLIDPLSQADAGTYTCIATNKTGQNSFSLELTVMAKEVKKAPIFLEKLQNCGVPEGHPVRLESRVVGMPPPVFYWKKDNESIPAHKPRIRCRAVSAARHDKQKTDITFQIINLLIVQTSQVKETYQVDAQDKKTPSRFFSIAHEKSKFTSPITDTTGYVCLLIQPAKKEDAGWYTLSAKNEAGIVSCTARLDIYAQWHQQIPQPIKKIRPAPSRYSTFSSPSLDILNSYPETPLSFFSQARDVVESEEL